MAGGWLWLADAGFQLDTAPALLLPEHQYVGWQAAGCGWQMLDFN